MKAILEFNLPEDDAEWLNQVHATALAVALWETRGMLRTYWKHADLDGMTADQLIDEIWEKFHDIAGAVIEATE